MAGTNPAVMGIYPTLASLEAGVKALKETGFRQSDISVLGSAGNGVGDSVRERPTKAPEGAATGASTGAMVGGALGWLAGVGSLAIPGVGIFVAAGPILAVLAGAGAAGIVGGIAGGMVGLGLAEDKAHYLQERIKEGGTLLSVHTDIGYWTRRAKEILESTGAQDISSTGASSGAFDKSETHPLRSA